MVNYDKDGVTLFYIDATGKKIAHNFLEGTPYSDMLDIRGAQLQALRENTQAQTNYATTLGNLQISVNAGRGAGIVAPPKPLQKVVSDTGDVSYAPFDPPLADLIPEVVNAPSAPIATGGLMGQMVRDGAAVPDKNAIMYNMILALFRHTFPDA